MQPLYHLPPSPQALLASKAPTNAPVFTGVVTLASGSVSALVPADDANTGLCFPAPDSLALVTGGATRLHVNASGAVGIGTNNPASSLHVVRQDGAGTQPFYPVILQRDSTTAAAGRSIGISYRDSRCLATVEAVRVNSAASYHAYLSFRTYGGATAPNSEADLPERVRIGADGVFQAGMGDTGAAALRVVPVAVTANRIEITGATVGGVPGIAAQGTDTDIHLRLSGKGTGTIILQNLPTTATGLPAGSLWRNGSSLQVV